MSDDELEAALRRVLTTHPEDLAAKRLLQRLQHLQPLPQQKRAFAWWPAALMDVGLAPVWPRVATLGAAALLGISIGLSSFGTRIATDLNLVRTANADDATTNAFDSDAGLRP